MDLAGKRFVLVGGAGFIGSHTTDLLLQHDVAEVILYDDFSRGSWANIEGALHDPRCKVFEVGGNICRKDMLTAALRQADGVFHFAALWLLQCLEFPRAAFDVNITGTFNVIEACVENGVKRLVYSSSASVYGDAVEEPMTEDHPLNNQTLYGATKIAGEALARAMHHRFGLPYVGLRYMNVYGPRQDYKGAYVAVIIRFLDSIMQRRPLTVHGDGSQAYDFVYVEDCARANVLAMQAPSVDRFYNVGTGIKTSLLELASLIKLLTGSSEAIELGGKAASLVKSRVGSTRRAEDELGFRAATSLESGLRKLIDWYAAARGMTAPSLVACGTGRT